MKAQNIDKNIIESFTTFMNEELFLIQDIVNYNVIPAIGENKYKYLNIFDIPNSEIITDELLDNLIHIHKIVSKSGHTMNLEGMSLINLHHLQGIRLQNILDKFTPKYISFWGADPNKLGIQLAPMKGVVFNGIKILRLESLEKTFNDEKLKAQTEQFLKYLFGIK